MKIKSVRLVRLLSKIILALGVLFLAVLAYGYFRVRPLNVEFTNISSSSITVSWVTKTKDTGLAMVEDSDFVLPFSVAALGENVSYDSRDVKTAELEAVSKTEENISESDSLGVKISEFASNLGLIKSEKYFVHTVTITNLSPETEYKVMVGDGLIFKNVSSKDLKLVKTEAVPDGIKAPVPTYGTVKNANNNGNVAIEDLPAVADGVVYFNYLDEATGNKSDVYSSALNSTGNWYIDISNAKASDGQYFLDKYSGTVTNILGQIKIDAGPLGVWEKTINMNESTPVETIVLNVPDAAQDQSNPESLVRVSAGIDSIFTEVIKSVKAQDSDCKWLSYCGCGKSVGGQWQSCSCDSDTLKARGCGGQQSAQEAANAASAADKTQCQGGGLPGAYTNYGGSCKHCELNSTKSFYLWVATSDSSKCTGIADGHVDNSSADTGSGSGSGIGNSVCGNLEGASCGTNSFCTKISGKSNLVCLKKDDDPDDHFVNRGENFLCQDIDGCNCLYNDGVTEDIKDTVSVDVGKYCPDNKYQRACPSGQSRDTNGICKALPKGWKTGDICSTGGYRNISGDCVTDGASCSTNDSPPKAGTYSKGVCGIVLTPELAHQGDSCGTNSYIDSTGACRLNGGNCTTPITLKTGNWTKGVCIPITVDKIPKPVDCWENMILNDLYKYDSSTGKTYRCDNGSWVEDSSKGNISCSTNDICHNPGERCVSDKGLVLYCPLFGGNWKEATDSKAAVGIEPIQAGTKCSSDNGWCICATNSKKINNNEYCIQVKASECYKPDNNGKVCSKDETHKVCFDKNCVKESDVKGVSTRSEVNIEGIANKVVASELDTNTKYVVDSSTGMLSGLTAGSYIFEFERETYYFEVSNADLDAGNGGILVYIDKNNNGEYDEGTDTRISDLASEINISALQQKYDFTLKQGFNFVSFPFLISDTESRTAASLLSTLNDVYGDAIYSIAKFDGTWKVVGQNAVLYDNNDFQLIPGQGYVIKASRDVDISIVGQPVQYDTSEDSAPILLNVGWNLIGLYGTGTKTYTAEALIDGINDFSSIDFTADNVSKWDNDSQMYEGIQKTIENGNPIVYGFDFPIELQNAYFVKVTQGSGNWEPEIGE